MSRNKTPLFVASIAAVILAVFGAFSLNQTWQEKRRAEQERRLAIQARAEAELNEQAALSSESKMTKMAKEATLNAARAALETNPRQALQELKKLASFPGFDDFGQLRLLAADAIYRGVPRELGSLSERHQKTINAVEYSPDGKLLATASNDGTAKLWSIGAGTATTLRGHSGAVWTVKFSQDGKLLASGGEDGAVRLWDTSNGELKATLSGHTGYVMDVAFSHNGKYLASTARDQSAKLWELSSGKELWSVALPSIGNDVEFSLDDAQLACVDFGGPPHLIEVATGKAKLLSGVQSGSTKIRFSPNGEVLAAAGLDSIIRLWDLSKEGEPRLLSGHIEPATELEFSPDGAWLASAGYDKTARVWEVESCLDKACQGSLVEGPGGSLNSLSFSPDSAMLALGSSDNSVYLVGLRSKKLIRTLRGHSDFVWGVAFSPAGQALASVGSGEVFLWDLSELELCALHSGTTVSWIDFSPDAAYLAAAREDGALEIWDISTKTSRRFTGHKAALSSVSFSPDGRMLASGDKSGEVLLWDTQTWTITKRLKGHQITILDLRFSASGEWLASTSDEGVVRLWGLRSGEEREISSEAISIDFSPDSSLLSTVGNSAQVEIWSVREAKLLRKIPVDHEGRQVRFSPDGRSIAVAGQFAPLRIFGIEGEAAQLLYGHRGTTDALTFSKDGSFVFSANSDGTTRVWDMKSRESRPLFSDGLSPLFAVAFSQKGPVAFSGADGQIYLVSDKVVPNTPSALLSWLKAR